MITQKMITGTQTDGDEPNYVVISAVQMQIPTSKNVPKEVDPVTKELGGYGAGEQPKMQVLQKIVHEGEVNRARCMPQNPYVIATRTTSGETHIFNTIRHPLVPASTQPAEPEIRLKGLRQEGFGLSWNAIRSGYILASSNDHNIAFWDITEVEKHKTNLMPLKIFEGHTDVASDVQWHPQHEAMFASVGDDGFLLLWDTRQPKTARQSKRLGASLNTVAHSLAQAFLIATGSAAGVFPFCPGAAYANT